MSITPTAGSMQVHQAWSHVMGDVQGIAKRDKNEQQRFLFRGIDAVMNAVGPALRAHGVVVMPVNVDVQTRDTKTTSGKDTRECQVVVTYRVIGPAGDWFEGMAPGEALDFSDKATAKAMSVAYRTGSPPRARGRPRAGRNRRAANGSSSRRGTRGDGGGRGRCSSANRAPTGT